MLVNAIYKKLSFLKIQKRLYKDVNQYHDDREFFNSENIFVDCYKPKDKIQAVKCQIDNYDKKLDKILNLNVITYLDAYGGCIISYEEEKYNLVGTYDCIYFPRKLNSTEIGIFCSIDSSGFVELLIIELNTIDWKLQEGWNLVGQLPKSVIRRKNFLSEFTGKRGLKFKPELSSVILSNSKTKDGIFVEMRNK